MVNGARQKMSEVSDVQKLMQGIYDISSEMYHADPRPPSLSASIGWELINKSPLHARTKHPRLNPDFQPEVKDHFDLGSAAHNMVLRQDFWREEIKVIDKMAANLYAKKEVEQDPQDWKTAAARAARDAARANGLYPILADQYERLNAMVSALEAHPQAGKAFRDGKPEQTLIWQDAETGSWLRCRPDWMPVVRADHFGPMWPDYKTTTDARPHVWDRRFISDHGGLLRAAFYEAGIRAVCGVEKPTLYYVIQEVNPPYAVVCRVMPMDSELMDAARGMFRKAVTTWANCLEKDEWPSYDLIGQISVNEWRQQELTNEFAQWTPREPAPELTELDA